MCVCVCVCVHAHVHSGMCMCVYRNTSVCVYVLVCRCICTHVFMCVCVCVYMCLCVQLCTCMWKPEATDMLLSSLVIFHLILIFINFHLSCVCVCVCVCGHAQVPQYMRGGSRTTFGSWLSPSTIESQRFNSGRQAWGKHLSSWSRLTDPLPYWDSHWFR